MKHEEKLAPLGAFLPEATIKKSLRVRRKWKNTDKQLSLGDDA